MESLWNLCGIPMEFFDFYGIFVESLWNLCQFTKDYKMLILWNLIWNIINRVHCSFFYNLVESIWKVKNHSNLKKEHMLAKILEIMES
jgi:hypothetical protein